VVFKWDPRKAAANLKKHRIDFREAATVLNDTLSTTFPDTDQSSVEPRFVTLERPRGRILVVVPTEEGDTVRIISARQATRHERRFYEEEDNRKSANGMRQEYDFASMKGGVRGKYVTQYRAGTNLVLLDPELAEAFPTDAAVNDLRAVLKMTEAVRRPNKTLLPAARKTRHG
jgi:uncharacterized protein